MKINNIDIATAQLFKTNNGLQIITFAVKNMYINDEQGRLGTFPYRLINVYPSGTETGHEPVCSIVSFPDTENF